MLVTCFTDRHRLTRIMSWDGNAPVNATHAVNSTTAPAVMLISNKNNNINSRINLGRRIEIIVAKQYITQPIYYMKMLIERHAKIHLCD